MPQVLLANPIELPQINVQRSLQSLAAFQGERLPDALSVDQWISRFSQYVSLKVEQGVTRYDFDDQAAGAAGASDFGILAKMSCAAYNSQPEDRRRHGPGLGLPQVEELRPAAGGEQARYTAYWWGYTIWCNHVLCIDLENALYGAAGAASVAALIAPLIPTVGHVVAVICAALALAGKLYGDAFKWADGKCQAANVNATWLSPGTPWISQPC